MEIVNQPFKQSLGFRLIEKIQSGHFSVFHFMVAYAKTSGVNRLLPYMRQFKENGGTINVKIEVSAAEILNTAYPIDKGKRPILIFKRVNPTLFEYMLLMEGNPGYEELNKRLLGLDWHHKSLRYEVIDADTMLTLWEDCPLI